MSEPNESRRRRWVLPRLRRTARDAASGAVAVGAGAATGSPVVAALITPMVEQAFDAAQSSFYARPLSPEERRRAERVLRTAHEYVFNRRASGDAPAEWVLRNTDEPRAAPIEVLEAGLLRARDEFEEKKLDHLGHLLGWLLFHPNLSAADAQHFLALGSSLRYRQTVLISLFADDAARRSLPDEQWGDAVAWADMALIMETAQLVDAGILLHEGGIHGPGSFQNINPSRLSVLLHGSVLYEGMDLRRVSQLDRDDVLAQLQHVHKIVLKSRET